MREQEREQEGNRRDSRLRRMMVSDKVQTYKPRPKISRVPGLVGELVKDAANVGD